VIDYVNKAETLPEYLDDGGLIARRIIELPDRNEDMGAMLARSMIARQHEEVGDGTATAAVLLAAIFDAGIRYIAAGGNAMQLRRQLEATIPLIFETLDGMVTTIEGQPALTRMAYTLCHDETMAQLLGEAFDLVGDYGRLEIREGYGRELRLEYVEGTYYESGLISRTILPDDAGTRIELENAAVFICDFPIDNPRDLYPVLQTAFHAGFKNLIIILRDLSEQGVSLLATNNRMGKLTSIALKIPGLNETDLHAALEDLCVLTGAVPILKATGALLEQVTPDHFGRVRRSWADLRAFGMVGGKGDPRLVREHIQRLKARYQAENNSDERDRTRKRIGKLLGGSVTLWVGGFTEPEIQASKSLAERSAMAMRTALEHGVVPGGGIALLNVSKALQKEVAGTEDTDKRAAYRMLIEALEAPARAIYQNSGCDPSEVMAKLYDENGHKAFDVLTRRVVDAYEAGIFDSVAVLKSGLKNAIHTAALALTTDTLVHVRQLQMVKHPDGTSD
jgi:chaperonin GroEL